jgi:serine/threonine protein phosphatase PrpC
MKAMDFIARHWPELLARVPEGAAQAPMTWPGEAVCTRLDAWDPEWVHSRGGRAFVLDPRVPDGFFACGLQYRGSEYLFAMWREGARRFAFHDQYLQSMGADAKALVARRLRSALQLWDAGEELFVFSGPWGRYRPAQGAFGHDAGLTEIGLGVLVEAGNAEVAPPTGQLDDCTVAAASLGKAGSSHNRDAFAWSPLPAPDGPLLIAVVCDGVSSSPRGGEAARAATGALLASARWRAANGIALDDLLRRSILDAHAAIQEQLEGQGVCTLVAAALDPRQANWAWGSVGDSGVYVYVDGGLRKLNREDRAARLKTLNGEVVFGEDGTPFIESGLSQAIGSLAAVSPEVGWHERRDGSTVCLASDGVSGPRLLASLEERPVPGEDAVIAFCDAARRASDDDATLLLVRMGGAAAASDLRRRLKDYAALSRPDRDEALAAAARAGLLTPELVAECLTVEADEDAALHLVEVVASLPARLPLPAWRTLADAAARRGQRRLLQRIVAEARRASVRR